jgi:hypothetical protein
LTLKFITQCVARTFKCTVRHLPQMLVQTSHLGIVGAPLQCMHAARMTMPHCAPSLVQESVATLAICRCRLQPRCMHSCSRVACTAAAALHAQLQPRCMHSCSRVACTAAAALHACTARASVERVPLPPLPGTRIIIVLVVFLKKRC